jgi:type I restriction enzyme S subunit
MFFQSPAYWDIVKANATGAAQPNINGTKLGEFKIPLPHLDMQSEIVRKMSLLNTHISELKHEIKQKIDLLVSTKSSILNSAFKGEL